VQNTGLDVWVVQAIATGRVYHVAALAADEVPTQAKLASNAQGVVQHAACGHSCRNAPASQLPEHLWESRIRQTVVQHQRTVYVTHDQFHIVNIEHQMSSTILTRNIKPPRDVTASTVGIVAQNASLVSPRSRLSGEFP